MSLDSILPVPDPFQAKRLLCVQPHYDDNDIGAGGTLALLRAGGAELVYLTVTDDLMGVTDASLSAEAAARALQRDREAAGQVIGVSRQVLLGYPDAGEYDYFTLRRDLLTHVRQVKPDFVFAPDPWLTYEAHRDHVRTGLAAAEAVILAGLTRIASNDPAVDAAYAGHAISGAAFYYTREPNLTVDVSAVWGQKLHAVGCYTAQFTSDGMQELVMALELKSRQAAGEQGFQHGEPLKVLHPAALHCGI